MCQGHSSKVACFFATAFLAVCVVTPAQGQYPHALVLEQTIRLPALHGRFNHMSVDGAHQRLFVPAPADNVLEIVDVASGKLWRSLPVEKPTTALYAPESHQLYLTSSRNLSIYDAGTLDRTASIDLHSRLDEIGYDPSAHELFVGRMTDGKTGIAIVAVPQGKLLAIIVLPSLPQGFALETRGSHLFVNLPDEGAVAVIDRRKREVTATWKLEGAGDNFPMTLDEKNKRLFIATRTPAQMLALDTRTGVTIARVPCVQDADDMWYDAARSRIYISGGGSSVSVIQQQGPDRYKLLEGIRTPPDASNSALSSQKKNLYIGVPPHDGDVAEIRVYSTAP